MSSVSAKDFQRHPGRYQRMAQAAPVTITNHGEPSLVLMNVREYERLKRRDRQVLAVEELSAEQADELLAAFKESGPTPEAAKFDKELTGRKA